MRIGMVGLGKVVRNAVIPGRHEMTKSMRKTGYVAADALYDGPFCILSAVDNRCYKRILYDVLDHDPTHADIRAFLGRLQTALSARDLILFGVTTDGSALSPEPLREVFGEVPHHICEFHLV